MDAFKRFVYWFGFHCPVVWGFVKSRYCVINRLRSCLLKVKHFSFDWSIYSNYPCSMDRITYNTRMDKELIKQFKILAIEQEKRQNQMLEEAIKDLLVKYGKKTKE